MSNIKIIDLLHDPDSFIQDLSEDELRLQGGCDKIFKLRLPNGTVIIGGDKCMPVSPSKLFLA